MLPLGLILLMKTLRKLSVPLLIIAFVSLGYLLLTQNNALAVDQCNGDAKCQNNFPNKPYCKNKDANNSTCVQCKIDAHCPSNQRCNSSNECVNRVSSPQPGDECDSDSQCASGVCQSPAQNDSKCVQCTPTKLKNCGSNQECVNNKCVVKDSPPQPPKDTTDDEDGQCPANKMINPKLEAVGKLKK